MKRLFLSVVIPTCNRPEFLSRSLCSVLAQSHSDIEVIVVDNSDGNETEDLISAINDSRIVYVKHRANIGMLLNMAYGINIATGSYVALLPDDDIVHPEFIHTCVSAIAQYPSLTSYFVAFDQFHENINISSLSLSGLAAASSQGNWRQPSVKDLHNQTRCLSLCAGIHDTSYLKNAIFNFSWAGIAIDTAIMCDILTSRKSLFCASVLYWNCCHELQATYINQSQSLSLEISVYQHFLGGYLSSADRAGITRNMLLDLAIALDNYKNSSGLFRPLTLRYSIFKVRPLRLRNTIMIVVLAIEMFISRINGIMIGSESLNEKFLTKKA